MTTEELRTIDAQVAEKVMGWTRIGAAKTDVREWKPSTSIAHAFEVVEKLRPTFCIDITGGNGSWLVDLVGYKADVYEDATNDSLPLAICLAALKAVEQQEAKR